MYKLRLPAAPNSKVSDECWYLTWPLILDPASPKDIPPWPVQKIVIPVLTVWVDPNTASLYTELAVPWGELSYTKFEVPPTTVSLLPGEVVPIPTLPLKIALLLKVFAPVKVCVVDKWAVSASK